MEALWQGLHNWLDCGTRMSSPVIFLTFFTYSYAFSRVFSHVHTVLLFIDNRKRAVIIVVAADSSIVDEEYAYLDLTLYLSFCATDKCVMVIRSRSCTVHDLRDMIVRRKH
jgi:hypothetical protein